MSKLIQLGTPTGNIIRLLTPTETDPDLLFMYIKDFDINTNLPTWSQVSNAIDNANNLSDAKVILKKLARVVYLMAKNSDT